MPNEVNYNILLDEILYGNISSAVTNTSPGSGIAPPPLYPPVTGYTLHSSPSQPPIPVDPFEYHEPPTPYWNTQPVRKRKMKKGNKLYNIPLIDAFPHKLRKRQTDGEVGLEIEVEGKKLFDTPIKWWVKHDDGSLREVEGQRPIEYVLEKPIPRQDIPKALAYLSKKLRMAESEVVASSRTSVHVHVNCQKMTMKEIYSYICLYYIFEDLLVEWCGPGRIGNLFSLGGKHAEFNVHILEQSIRNEAFDRLFDNELRYSACNTASLGKFGSLEFRSLRGTVDPKVIQLWVDTVLTLKDESLKYSDPRKVVEDFLRLTPGPFLYKIFHRVPMMYESLRGIQGFHQRMWDGLRLMRDVAYAIDWKPYEPALEKEDKKVEPLVREYFHSNMMYKVAAPSYGEGWYWLVNVTDSQKFFRWQPNGSNWHCQADEKLLFDPQHRFQGEFPAEDFESVSDLETEAPSVSVIIDEAGDLDEPYVPSYNDDIEF